MASKEVYVPARKVNEVAMGQAARYKTHTGCLITVSTSSAMKQNNSS